MKFIYAGVSALATGFAVDILTQEDLAAALITLSVISGFASIDYMLRKKKE